LTLNCGLNTMSALRKAITKALKAKRWTRYRLAKELGDEMTMPHVYQFLDGKSDMSTSAVEKVLEVLGLVVMQKTEVEKLKEKAWRYDDLNK
jgi:predicted transcriptional regulator